MAETPRLDLPYLSASQAQKEIMHNVSLDRLDLLVQCTVLDRNLPTPPASPVLGDAYIVGPAPTGAWAGHANDLALYINLQWQFIAPLPGFQCWVLDEAAQVGWSGSAWTITASGGAGATTLLALTDTPDTYTGQAGKTLLVNPGETGMVFGTVAGSAPVDATYIVSSSHATLSAERVVTDTTQITWDVSTAGQLKAALAAHGVALDKLPQQPPGTLLGRGGSLELVDDVQVITVGAGLALSGTTLSATGGGGGGGPVTEAELSLSDVTDDNASTTQHGLLPKLSGVATEYLDGTGLWTVPPTTETLTHAAWDWTTATSGAVSNGHVGVNHADVSLGTEIRITELTTFNTNMAAIFTTLLAGDSLSIQDRNDATKWVRYRLTTPPVDQGTWWTMAVAYVAGPGTIPNNDECLVTIGEAAGSGGGSTTFLGLTDTPDSYAGQGGKGVVVNGAATGLEFTTAATGSYDLGLTWAGTLPASQVLLRYPFPRAVDFPAGLTGSQGRAAVAATALTTLDLRKNGTSVGSVQYAASATTATFTMASATSFAAGDVLTVHAPVSADATLADLGVSLAGTRAVVAGEMGATTWLGLTDTPDAYTGQGGKVVQVNAGATATEFGPVLGTLATQNANAVAITGGGAVNLSAFSVNAAPGTTYFGYDVLMQTRLAVGTGIAPTYPLDVTGDARVNGKVGIQGPPAGFSAVDLYYLKNATDGMLVRPTDSDGGAGTALKFLNVAQTVVGSISTNASATAFNTSSDVRLKHAIQALLGGLTVIQALKPVRFLWNADGSPGIGFLAHELQRTIPEAVTGEPDALDAQGNILPQGVDHSKIVPWLTAALKELIVQVETLQARVATLEAALG